MAYTSVKISANSSDYQSQMKSAAAQMKVLSAEYTTAATKAKLFGSETDSLKAKAESLTQKITVQKGIVQLNSEQQEKLTKKLSEQKTKQEELKGKIDAAKEAYAKSTEETGKNSEQCRLELDGYKGTYIGFITSNDYEKKNVKQRYVVNVEFDGFFVDDDLSITFDGKTSASFYKVGTRDTPCVVEVYAKSTLTNYTITGLGEDIIVESLAAGKTVVIDAKTGLVTIDGANAFDKVDLWEFPVLKAGETALIFSNTKARVTVRYTPMWI